MDTKITCPLGHECERAVGNTIERCAWFVKLRGKDPQDGSDINSSRCAIAWQPILAIEANGLSNQTGAAIESLRNETVKRQDIALKAVVNAKTITDS